MLTLNRPEAMTNAPRTPQQADEAGRRKAMDTDLSKYGISPEGLREEAKHGDRSYEEIARQCAEHNAAEFADMAEMYGMDRGLRTHFARGYKATLLKRLGA